MNQNEYINTLEIGTRLVGSDNQRYRIKKVLGQGTFGITYLATTNSEISSRLGRVQGTTNVAIKEFYMRDINDRNGTSVVGITKDGVCDKYRRRFAAEARNLSRLDHPRIVHVSDAFDTNNTSYFVMEYCDAGSLDDYIARKGKLSEQEALYFFRHIAEALSYMHSHSMLHLDLKPANVVLRYNEDDDNDRPEAVLVDFGLSKQFVNGVPESSTALGFGTPGYAPMEQGQYQAPDPNENVSRIAMPVTMDVYALGATLFKMLTGVPPQDASTLYNYGFPRHKLETCHVSKSLIDCIARAMAPAVRDRYATVEEFAQAVAGVSSSGTQREKTSFDSGDDTRYDIPYDSTIHHAPEREVEVIKVLENKNELPTRIPSMHNGHEYVDLGLPSGLKWATCNVGAKKPEEYGDYFAWGETETKSEYTEENSVTYIDFGSKFKRFFGGDRHKKEVRDDISGDLRYDAARKHWGGSWRMPTQAECQELKDKCTWTWTSQGGHAGYRVTGPNGNSIFLPASGCRLGSSLSNRGEYGYYWSSTPDESNTNYSCSLYFSSSGRYVGWFYRSLGRTVRPVSE